MLRLSPNCCFAPVTGILYRCWFRSIQSIDLANKPSENVADISRQLIACFIDLAVIAVVRCRWRQLTWFVSYC